uniref:Transposase n=1 Tax=Angiostrongylus cantonensis TaxID=6313 RepID=A0A0K0CVU9_ANGCA
MRQKDAAIIAVEFVTNQLLPVTAPIGSERMALTIDKPRDDDLTPGPTEAVGAPLLTSRSAATVTVVFLGVIERFNVILERIILNPATIKTATCLKFSC